MRFSTFLLALLTVVMVHAQGQPITGQIVGTVMDITANEPMPFATVAIKGTTKGSNTDFDGKFTIAGLEPGTYTLVVSFVGYQPLEMTYTVLAGEITEAELNLEANEVQLAEVVVEAKANTESEMAILQVQRKSVDIKQSIGSDELSRKGVGNAEAAVTKITGVSKQEGVKNVYVRGLGDRYNSTSLNGLPLPSEDPEYKNINLGFFGTDIINSIDVNKTFGSTIYGDVGGANINIVSKELFDDQELSIGLSSGVNGQVVGNSFSRIDGTSYFGATNVEPISDLSDYSFSNSFDPSVQNSPINSSFNFQGGKRFYLGEKVLNTFLIGSTGSSYGIKQGIARSSQNSAGGFGRDYTYSKYDYETNQSLLGSVGLELNSATEFKYNFVLIHSNSQGFGEYSGFFQGLSENDGESAFIRRQQVNDNTLIVNQLVAETDLSERISFEVAAGVNQVMGNEPDRRVNTFIHNENSDTYVVASGSAGLNHRFFSELDEIEFVSRAVATYRYNESEVDNIQVGYNLRATDRDFRYRQFSFNVLGQRPEVDLQNVDGIFNQSMIDNQQIEIQTNRGSVGNPDAFIPDSYDGRRNIYAGFINATKELSENLTVNVGFRLDFVQQAVTWDFNQDKVRYPGDNLNYFEKGYFLPSLNARYTLNDDNILRLSASKSYILPQFKELAPFLYEDIDFSSLGNPDLQPSDVYNIDLKFDHYFSRSELISITGFYKNIKNSINRILVESAATEMSYVNSGDANVFGLELEARKTLLNLTDSYLDFGLNVSYLNASQTLEDSPNDGYLVRFTNSTSALQGASPLLVNADLTFTKEGLEGRRFTNSLILSSFSNRIFTIGTNGANDIVSNTVPALDFISRMEMNDKLSLSASVKNILNPDVRRTFTSNGSNEEILINNYRNGINFSVGLSYKIY